MIEVIIVVMILSILAVAGVPALNATLDHARLSAAAEEVVNALQYAQLSAMTSGRQTRVLISPIQQSIDVHQYKMTADLFNGGNQLTAGNVESGAYTYMEYPLKKGADYLINLQTEDRFRGVYIFWSDFNLITPLYFYTLGHPSKGGTVTLLLKDQLMVVTLDALTGKVSVSQ